VVKFYSFSAVPFSLLMDDRVYCGVSVLYSFLLLFSLHWSSLQFMYYTC